VKYTTKELGRPRPQRNIKECHAEQQNACVFVYIRVFLQKHIAKYTTKELGRFVEVYMCFLFCVLFKQNIIKF
jgi:hypothetical protein